MTDDPPRTGRKRGTLLAIFGAIVADGSIVLWLLGGPATWLLGAALGCLLAALGVAKSRTGR